MVTIKKYLLIFLSPLLLVFITAACSQQGKVKTLTEIETGLTVSWSSKDENIKDECKKFQPTREQILSFFNKAQRVEGVVVNEDRYTPCFATGRLTWRDGTSAGWSLYSSGTASLSLDNGETLHLYQRDYHWFDPTECTYGMGDEGEC
ncbi:hypothetical protein LU604_04430 [Erwinia tracheiphila]|uniref:Lipoprotein n=1 Tax=Erwinia tracheiphila TaxID=65700 RepID=A0A345CUA9_9GAMM|nr:hypothetical protein [Erwinia tracheiphila]AXF77026.1 hypothetical protein AV903_14910 [Erwinia tracheiphila]UIA84288.1 hypothetical protein LU604_04430 [Erwinia tracheiphila]UIA92869.1 hypothetical protein LU632_04385 [Erwinia tracheiphila]